MIWSKTAPYLFSAIALTIMLLFPGTMISGDTEEAVDTENKETLGTYVSQVTHFVRNEGQIDNDDVIFYSEGGPLQIAFLERGLQYVLVEGEVGFSYFVSFDGANGPTMEPSEATDGISNYFRGSQESSWITDVPHYQRITYRNLYDDIDLSFHIEDGHLKYDFILYPSADHSDIRMIYSGPDISMDGPELLIDTTLGSVVERAPISFLTDGTPVPSSWMISEDGVVSYSVGRYDTSQTLIIDPILEYSTYVGGGGDDNGYSMDLDEKGFVYIAGMTYSNNFPTSSGAYDTSNAGSGDAFVFKLNRSGDRIIYSTFLGGSNVDYGYGLDVDGSGSAYVVGSTQSNNFPTTSGAYDQQFQQTQSNKDVFVTKLSAGGNSLVYSTYIGRRGDDVGRDIVVDGSGYAYITGYSSRYWNWAQYNYPTTSGAYDTSHNGGGYDAVVTKLHSNGGSLVYSTFLGDNDDDDYGMAIDIDSSGNAYVIGYTDSNGFPTTYNAFDRTYNGRLDIFVTKFNSAGSALSFSTYLGGSGNDLGYDIEVDALGRPYITGSTTSTGFPTTANGYQGSYQGNTDGFLTLVASNGRSLVNSSFIGGTANDQGSALAIDNEEFVYVAGITGSSNLPVTSDALYSTRSGGYDVYVMRMNMSEGGGLNYSTYLGGTADDYLAGVEVDNAHSIYLSGRTSSTTFPTTSNAYDTMYNNNFDLFASKIQFHDLTPRNLTATAGIFHINLSWDSPPDRSGGTHDFLGYTVYRGTSSSSLSPLAQVNSLNWYNDTIVQFSSRTFYYAITANFNVLGEGYPSNVVSAEQIVPAPPLNFEATPGDLSVSLGWDLVDQIYLDMFDVEYTVYKGLSRAYMFKQATLGVVDSYFDNDISKAPRPYFYRVSYTFNTMGEGIKSPILEVWPNTPPSPPTNLTGEASYQENNLSWSGPERYGGHPLSEYRIYGGDSPDNLVPIAALDGSTTDHLETEVVPGRYRYYGVSCSNVLGESPLSDIVEIKAVSIPSAPRALGAEPGDERITLTWETPEYTWGLPIAGFSLYSGPSPDQMTILTTPGPNQLSFVDTVQNGVVNYYFISASNVHGEGPFSGTVDALASGLPGQVEALFADLLPHGLILTWGDVDHDGGSAIEAYRIYRSETPYEDGRAVLERIPSGTHEYEDTSVEVGTTYYYWISAVNDNGEGPLSNVSSSLPAIVPGKIGTIIIGSSLSRISLQWEAPDHNGGMNIINYRIYRGTSTADLRPYRIVDRGTTSILDDELDQQLRYFYAVSAINDMGEGAISNTVSAVTTGDPDGPEITYSETGRSSISLRWEPPENDGGSPVDRYLVELEVIGGGIYEDHVTKDTQITAVGLVEGRIYAVQVTCINRDNGMGRSDILHLLVGDHAYPPKNIEVKNGDGYVGLTWEARSLESVPVTSYRIYMSDGGELFFFKEVPAEDRKLTIEGLINGAHYGFAISSVNEKGEGSLSTEVFATPEDYPDPVKKLWIEDTGNGYISIMWEPIDYNGGMTFEGYQLLRGTVSTKLVNVLELTPDNEFLDNDVDNGVLYYYQVRSVPNTGDNIGRSEIIQGMAMGSPSRPGNLNAEGTTDMVSLTWMAPEDDGGSPITGYLVYRAVGSGDMDLYATLDPDETTFEDLDVSEGSYTYRIVPFTDFKDGDWNEITVSIPSRTEMAAGLGALAFILPLIIIIAIIFLPGIIKKRREEKERLRMERDAKEALEREQNLLATRRGSPLLNGSVGAPSLPPIGHQAAPSMHALNPAFHHGQGGPVGNTSQDEGYTRPKDQKKKRKDKSKLLRSDGKSLLQREESDINDLKTQKEDVKKEDWHEHRQKVLEKEASSTFIGHQEDPVKERAVEPPKEEEIDPVPDIMQGGEIPDWSEGDMEISSPPDPRDPHLTPEMDKEIPLEEELEELEEMEEVKK